MLTKTKIALAAAVFATTSSIAMAQGFDPNMANRYPSYANPVAQAPRAAAEHRTLQSAPVRLQNQSGNYSGQESEIDVDRNDRASSPYAGGGF